jgi:SOS-response transcriptional repressor LexA
MPHSLTPLQRDYLDFLRSYIKENESSPSLEDIADQFRVKPPTAHKPSKHYTYFSRASISGFFIRLIERAGAAETIVELVTAGKLNRYSDALKFSKSTGILQLYLQA